MTAAELIEFVWLVILVPGLIRSAGLLRHSHGVARALAGNGAGLIYARGARAQEAVRFVAFVGLIAAVPIGHLLPGRGAVWALFVAACCLTVNTFLAGRLTRELEADEVGAPPTPRSRERHFRVFEKRRRKAFDESEAAEREAFDEGVESG